MCLCRCSVFSFQNCRDVEWVCVVDCVSCHFSVSSEITAGPDVRFSPLLSGCGVHLLFKALPARAHQLPGRDATPGSAGQGLARYYTFICPALLVKVWTDMLNWAFVAGSSVVPPFRTSGKYSDLLVLSSSESCRSWSKKSLPLSATQKLELENDPDRDNHR